MDYSGFAVAVFAAFMAISNPIATRPTFLSITHEDTDEVRKAIALRAVLVAFAIIAGLCVAGNALLGITVSALQLTGGAVTLVVGFRLLQGDPTAVQTPRPNGTDLHDGSTMLDTAISPLAVAILVGPHDRHGAELHRARRSHESRAHDRRVRVVVLHHLHALHLRQAARPLPRAHRHPRTQPADGARARRGGRPAPRISGPRPIPERAIIAQCTLRTWSRLPSSGDRDHVDDRSGGEGGIRTLVGGDTS
jgi:small neutral amino acid transporter SnatA (MarC family)